MMQAAAGMDHTTCDLPATPVGMLAPWHAPNSQLATAHPALSLSSCALDLRLRVRWSCGALGRGAQPDS